MEDVTREAGQRLMSGGLRDAKAAHWWRFFWARTETAYAKGYVAGIILPHGTLQVAYTICE